MTDGPQDSARRAYEIYLQALDLDPDLRAALVARETGGKPELEAEVARLLDSAEQADSEGFLAAPLAAPLSDAALNANDFDPNENRQIGPYRLIRLLGEGGFGSVYLAQQDHPVSRQVAIKLIRADLCNAHLIARFEAERQTLALLNHPNVAQIFDAGTGPGGAPYLVMEYIEGLPINRYCRDQQLDLAARLRLFIPVCLALNHAHQKGVIHRDVKPANVLVTNHDNVAVPKVIDFGIAKVLDLKINEQTLATGTGLLGSPSYMSPEQIEASDLDIDTRSDVYTLGVLLHEMLTGTPPFVADGDGVVALLNKILTADPVRPSRYLSQRQDKSPTGSGTAGQDASLSQSLPDDLDWIILKALSRDRERRYQSAAELASDLQRHLDNEPVFARPPTLGYRAKKFVRRHTLGVTAAALLVLTLIGGVVGTSLGFINAREEAARARSAEAQARVSAATAVAQTQTAEQTVALLLEFLSSADPRQQGRDVKVVQLLELFQPRLEELAGQREIHASLLNTYARTYKGLGLYEEAGKFAQQALAVRKKTLGNGDPATLASHILHVDILRELGQYERAEAAGREAMGLASASLGPSHELTLLATSATAATLEKQAQFEPAEALLRSTLAQLEATVGPAHEHTLSTMRLLSTALWHQNKLTEAEVLNAELLQRRTATLGAEHPDTLEAMNELAVVITETGRLADGEALHRSVLEIRQRVLGLDHPRTLISMANLAWVLGEQGRHDEAEALTRQAWEIEKRVLGPDHPSTLVTQGNLAAALQRLGQLADAESMHRDVLGKRQNILGSEHPATLVSLNDLAVVMALQGRNEPARELFADLVQRRRATQGPEHPGTLTSMGNLASVYRRLGDFVTAEKLYRETLAIQLRVMGVNHPKSWRTTENLATALVQQDKLKAAEALLREALSMRRKALGHDHPDSLRAAVKLADVRNRQGYAAEAREMLEAALEIQIRVHGTDHVWTERTRTQLQKIEPANPNLPR